MALLHKAIQPRVQFDRKKKREKRWTMRQGQAGARWQIFTGLTGITLELHSGGMQYWTQDNAAQALRQCYTA